MFIHKHVITNTTIIYYLIRAAIVYESQHFLTFIFAVNDSGKTAQKCNKYKLNNITKPPVLDFHMTCFAILTSSDMFVYNLLLQYIETRDGLYQMIKLSSIQEFYGQITDRIKTNTSRLPVRSEEM